MNERVSEWIDRWNQNKRRADEYNAVVISAVSCVSRYRSAYGTTTSQFTDLFPFLPSSHPLLTHTTPSQEQHTHITHTHSHPQGEILDKAWRTEEPEPASRLTDWLTAHSRGIFGSVF